MKYRRVSFFRIWVEYDNKYNKICKSFAKEIINAGLCLFI